MPCNGRADVPPCFNEARRESPGSPRVGARRRAARAGFNEARRESPGSQLERLIDGSSKRLASMRPGANRRDHSPSKALTDAPSSCFNEARRESPGSPAGLGVSLIQFIHASMRPGANRRDHRFSVVMLLRPIGASMRPGANRRDHGPDTGCHTISSCAALCERSPNVLTASPTEPLKPDTIRYRHWSARSAGAAPATGR